MRFHVQKEALRQAMQETTPFSQLQKQAIPVSANTGQPVITRRDFLKRVGEKHTLLWQEFFAKSGATMSSIRLDIYPAETIFKRRLSTGYTDDDEKVGIISIVFPEESLTERYLVYQSETTTKPPVWETELLHELVHEYAIKLVEKPTPEGRTMHRNEKIPFPGGGHDEHFYTAICAIATKREISAQQFRECI